MKKIDLCFVKNSWNYYSLATIFASIEDFEFVNPFIINFSDINKFSYSNETVFCFSLNSFFYKKYRDFISSLIKAFKERGKHFFIAGGPHCQNNPLLLLEDGFDVVVVGSGEKAIRKILEDIRDKKELIRVVKEEVYDINEYKPFPVKYFKYKPIEITRGCPHCCYFCQTSYLFGTKVLERTIPNILHYVGLAFKRNIKDFRFISPNAFSYGASSNNRFAIEELLSSIRNVIKDKGRIFFGTFPSEVRPDFVTAELMDILRKYVDNRRIIIGAQSGSDRILKISNRAHDVKSIENAIEIVINSGFSVDLDIILGMPDETEEDTAKTFNLIHRYKDKPVRFHLHYFMPLPGTPWFNKSPVELNKKFLGEIEYLTGSGLVWGNWRDQKRAVAKEY